MAVDALAQNNAQAVNLSNFLKYARLKPDIVQTGSVTTAVAGGTSASTVNWTPSDVPEVPAWATGLMIQFSFVITLSLPANSTATVSPYAPYCLLQQQLLLAGAPAFPLSSAVPWWIDDVTSRRRYDPNDAGVGLFSGNQEYQGPTPWTMTNATPGGTIANATTAATTVTVTMKCNYFVRLQRRHYLLWGCVPMGDPENRPRLVAQLSALVGPDPVDSPFQDVAAAGITAVLAQAGVVTLTWWSRSLDLLPPGLTTIPQPIVGMGTQLDSDTAANVWNAGAIGSVAHRTSMLYEKIIDILENNQQAKEPDYIALWTTGDQQSARYAFDSAVGNLQDYYDWLHRTYGRYLPKGCIMFDLESGFWPERPAESPYDGLMSPDVNYAAAAGVAPTPAMHTALRYATGTSMVAARVRVFSLGLVAVPY